MFPCRVGCLQTGGCRLDGSLHIGYVSELFLHTLTLECCPVFIAITVAFLFSVQVAHSENIAPGVIINQRLEPGAGEGSSKAKVQSVDLLSTRRRAMVYTRATSLMCVLCEQQDLSSIPALDSR